MLQITPAQYDALAKDVSENFVRATAQKLRLSQPEITRPMAEPALQQFVRDCLPQLHANKLDGAEEATGFAEAALLLSDPGFDLHPARNWARIVIRNRHLTEAERAKRLVDFAAAERSGR